MTSSGGLPKAIRSASGSAATRPRGKRLGRDEPVVEIHGSVKRQERRKIIHSFMNDPETLILVANDAAARDAGLPAWEVEATLASAERTATGDDDEFKRSVIRLAALPPHEYDRERHQTMRQSLLTDINR